MTHSKHINYFLAIIILDAIFAYFVIVEGVHDLYRENSWAENLQVVFLVIACVIFARSGYKQNGSQQVLCWFFAMICFAFIFREIDFERIEGMPKSVVYMLAGEGRGFFFAIILGLLARIISQYKHYFTHLKAYLTAPTIIYFCMLAPFMLVFSHVFDRKIWMLEHRVFFEELAEMTSYCFLVCAALCSFEDLQKIKHTSEAS